MDITERLYGETDATSRSRDDTGVRGASGSSGICARFRQRASATSLNLFAGDCDMIDYRELPPECDSLCEYRNCFHKGENNGTFSLGRGYTSFFKTPEYVCMTRMLNGCPHGPINERPMPDFNKFMKEITEEIDNAKCTKKVKRQMDKYKNIIRMLSLTFSELNKKEVDHE